MKRIGVILAAGSGSRMEHLTRHTSKHLLPVYDVPLIFFSFQTMAKLGIKEVVLVIRSEHEKAYRTACEPLKQFTIHYAFQDEPKGMGDAFAKALPCVSGKPVALLLADNIFRLPDSLWTNLASMEKSCVLGIRDRILSAEGAIIIPNRNQPGEVGEILEKPHRKQTEICLTGLYLLDELAITGCRLSAPSSRGEVELIGGFATQKKLLWVDLDKEAPVVSPLETSPQGHYRYYWWLDAGTPDRLLLAGKLVEDLRKSGELEFGRAYNC